MFDSIHRQRQMIVGGTEIAIGGRLVKTARLRHEWFEYLYDPKETIDQLQHCRPVADVFTFVQDINKTYSGLSFAKEMDSLAILPVVSYEKWWNALHFKVRNKIRKARKSGVELRQVALDDQLATDVELIYNESPIRQGKKFWHYGKNADVIKQDLSSFPDRTFFTGAYCEGELIGFMKLYEGENILRTVHIIAKLSHRDKPIQDALIAKAVEICAQKQLAFLHYGSWSLGGLGTFKIKHGFARVDAPRYFVPLTAWGRLSLRLGLHHPIHDVLPQKCVEGLLDARRKWNSIRYGSVVVSGKI